MKSQKGFTLIELVIVIIVLGILAAFLLPKFGSMEQDARVAVTRGLDGSIRGAAAIVHSAALTQNITDGTVTLPTGNVTVVNSYPAATTAGITNALETIEGFTDSGAGVFTKTGAPNAGANCKVTYAEPANAGDSPTITTDVSDC